MQSRFLLPILALSVVAAIASTVRLIQEQNRVYSLTLAAGSETGEYYAFGQAFATVVARHEPKIQIQVLATNGSPENMQFVANQSVQLALVQSDTPVKPSVRAMAQLFPEVFHLIAAADSGIRQFSDLKGKRIALMPEGSGSYTLFWPLSQHYGLQKTDFDITPLPPTEAHKALIQGKVDALFRIIGLGNPAVSELLKSGKTRLLPIDQVEALQLSLPYVTATQIPKGAYDGGLPIPAENLEVVAVNALLATHENVDHYIVQILTHILYEFRNELIAENPRAALIRSPEVSKHLGFPLHPGAEAYYNQDKPNFLVEYAEPISLLFSVSILAISGIWQFRLWLIGRQKNRADMYNLEILDLIDQVHKTGDLYQLMELRLQLFKILRQVVVDLDIDRISPESFQSFTFPWEVALTTIRHQEMMLMNKDKPQ